jgi:ribosomal protein S18 acetylase RimI-like enzyme
MTELLFSVEKEPSQDTIDQIVAIAQDYTADYFTENLPSDTRNDLHFQRAACLKNGNEIVSFIVFTCLDGCPHITLLATKRKYAGKRYGKSLMHQFVAYVDKLGFRCIEVLTVLPESKPVYFSTVQFYKSVGFVITDTYPFLWESGAIKLKKSW